MGRQQQQRDGAGHEPAPFSMLTRISQFRGWTAKREDEAFFSSPDYPAGAKVRQYARMALAAPGAPMVVGCSSSSAMQIYVAAAAKLAKVPGIIYTSARAEPTAATRYAMDMGAEVVGVRPAYLSVCRARARERARALGRAVRWDYAGALRDAAWQVQNVPEGTKRIVVPTGSGLIAAGVLVGLAQLNRRIPVVAACVSGMATYEGILQAAHHVLPLARFAPLEIVRTEGKYEKWVAARLPDGSVLDPYYAAKALKFVQLGDCLWLPGVRPLASLPQDCLNALGVFGN